MPDPIRARLSNGYRLVAESLSGRLLFLTVLYVLMVESLIVFPAIGIFYRSLLRTHVEAAEIAILPFTELANQSLSPGLRGELLEEAGVSAVMLKRPEQRELFLLSEMPHAYDVKVDLRSEGFFGQIADALDCLMRTGNRILLVSDTTRINGAERIEVVLNEETVRSQLTAFSWRILVTALGVSAGTAVLVFVSLYRSFVRPMRRIVQAMSVFRADPEDASRIISASRRKDEIGITERELGILQRELFGFLQQKGRLAALGSAVAKIQHDLRNILTSAQLASDRLADSSDPVVKRLAPRLVASIDRAVRLATDTMRYGRADEAPPARRLVPLGPIAMEACDAALFGAGEKRVALSADIGKTLMIDADPEQLYRILLNLLRNAVEAVADGGEVRVRASRQAGRVSIDIADSGPGIAPQAQARLFQPFASTARAGGTGLGLAICRELAKAHGGDVRLIETGAAGTMFRIEIPDRSA